MDNIGETSSTQAPTTIVDAAHTGDGAALLSSRPCRLRLPDRRWHRIERIVHEYPDAREIKYDVTVGFYPDGRAGEIFVDPVQDVGAKWSFKGGSDYEGEIDNQAEAFSRLMQFGMTAGELVLCCSAGTLMRHALEVAAAIEAAGDARPGGN